MASFLGIQVHEESGPEQAIPRAPTASVAFLGRTLRGPVNRPVQVRSFAEFQQVFGGLWQPSPLGYAVEHFFDNGGRDAFVVRVVNGARAATLSLPTGAEPLVLEARRPGTREFLRACIDYDNIPSADQEHFNLTVQRVRTHGTEHVEDQEIFRAVSLSGHADLPLHAALAESELVRVRSAAPGLRPKCTVDASSGLATGYLQSNSDGDDGAPLTDYDLIGSGVGETGIFALNRLEHFSFLCIPPLTRDQDVGPSTLLVAARYCKDRRAMLILDPPLQWATTDEALRGLREFHVASENAVMYFPRILAHDKLRGRFESFAPGGAVAGMLARADDVWPVWSASEGEEPILRPGFRPICIVSEDRRQRLAALGVNTLQAIRSSPRLSHSPRTMAAGTAGSADWKYLSARRLALFILNSLERGTRWIVFSPIGTDIAGRAEQQITEFFHTLNGEGAFLGRAEGDAYFVICDQRVNPVHVDGVRRFNILIGFAAMRAGEFHAYLITHSVAGSQVKPVSLNRMNSSHYHPAQREDLNPEEREWVERLAGRFNE